MLIGYIRVSTGEQSLDLQRDALDRAGCERVYDDVCSGRCAIRTRDLARRPYRIVAFDQPPGQLGGFSRITALTPQGAR